MSDDQIVAIIAAIIGQREFETRREDRTMPKLIDFKVKTARQILKASKAD